MNDRANDIEQEIAARLKEARRRKFKSAAAAARSLGMNEVTLRAHENGQNGLPIDVAMRYCTAYGIDINWLLRGHKAQLFKADAVDGLQLKTNGKVAPGIYYDLNEPQDPIAPLNFPRPNPFFGVEVYLVDTDAWEPEIPRGAHLLCTPADSVRIRSGDAVVVSRDRAGLVELTIQKIETAEDGNVFLHSLHSVGGRPLCWLTGPERASGYTLLSIIDQVTFDMPRPPITSVIDAELPVRQRPKEPI